MITKHSTDCKMAFGRKDADCPRCQELIKGDAPRAGWQKAYFSKPTNDQQRCAEIRAHVHTSHCSPVCTFGDW